MEETKEKTNKTNKMDKLKNFFKKPRVKSLLQIIFFIILLFFAFVLIVYYHVDTVGRANYVLYEDAPECEAVIVPGALVYDDKRVSPMLADRLDVAYKLYNDKKVKKILVTGAYNEEDNYDEPYSMKLYLLNKGIPREDIFMDYGGYDTYNSIKRAKELYGIDKAIITTQDFHLFRALYIANNIGVDAKGIVPDNTDYPKRNYYLLREYGARFKAFWEVNVFKPEVSGSTYQITGNGAESENEEAKDAFASFD